MTFISKIFSFSLFLSLLIVFDSDPLPAQMFSDLKAAVVKITAEVEGIPKAGTGFIVRLDQDATYIVTAAHVVAGDKHPEVEFFTSRYNPVSVIVIRQKVETDIALLKAGGEKNLPDGLSALSLAPSLPLEEGDNVSVIGIPRSLDTWVVVERKIVQPTGLEIAFTGPIGEGNSGGPLIKDGQVVGMVIKDGREFGSAISAAIIKFFLEDVLPQPEPGKKRPPDPSMEDEFKVRYHIGGSSLIGITSNAHYTPIGIRSLYHFKKYTIGASFGKVINQGYVTSESVELHFHDMVFVEGSFDYLLWKKKLTSIFAGLSVTYSNPIKNSDSRISKIGFHPQVGLYWQRNYPISLRISGGYVIFSSEEDINPSAFTFEGALLFSF